MRFSYTNPVWDGYLADPFVLRWHGEYYAYGTDPQTDTGQTEQVIPVLHSVDFSHWELLGRALHTPTPAPGAPPFTSFWAPEVAERDGTFWMYYSAGSASNDELHRLRVACADHPAGPFRDLGRLLLPDEQFTIDAHPFRDPRDGRRYLFFAKDFFNERVGTGIAVVPLADDMVSVAGEVTTVLRASADWQIYQRNRTIYGAEWDAWHTVEGPCVVERDGTYFCFYSGGSWLTEQYGVGVGVAGSVLGPYHELGSGAGPPVLRSADHMFGPGHNTVVVGPDGSSPFFVYHAWDAARTMRRMCIDPLAWTADGPRCLGPTTGPQTVEL